MLNKIKTFLKISVLFTFTAGVFFLISCSCPCGRVYETQKVLMGTLFKIKASLPKNFSKEKFLDTANLAFSEVSRLESEMSAYKPDSIISAVNKNAGIKPIKITTDISAVIDAAQEISKLSNGAFDISFGPLGKLWNVKHRKTPPTDKEIAKAKEFVNYKNIILDKKNKTLFLVKKGMQASLGGVAKGYAAKKAADILKANGIKNFIINAGGDLYFNGKKSSGYWTSAVKNPNGRPPKPILKFQVKRNCAVVTSGNYERFFVYKGKKYHHIINPKTGYPAENTKSVTVFAQNPTEADAFATAFFVLGHKKSLLITEQRTDIAFIIITSEDEIIKSGNLSKFIEII